MIEGAMSKEPLYWSVADGWVYADDTSQKRVDEKRKREHEWVGLTDEDMESLFLNEDGVRFARYIEAKLREKNT